MVDFIIIPYVFIYVGMTNSYPILIIETIINSFDKYFFFVSINFVYLQAWLELRTETKTINIVIFGPFKLYIVLKYINL